MRQKGTVLATLMVVGGLAAFSAGEPADTVPARPKRVKVAVMDFDYGTITNHWWGTSDIGRGMADQVVDGLVNDGSVIVVERKNLDTVLAEQDLAHSDRANPDAARLAQLGKVYGVKYIVLGGLERAYYPAAGLAKFDRMVGQGLEVAYQDGSVTIYRVMRP